MTKNVELKFDKKLKEVPYILSLNKKENIIYLYISYYITFNELKDCISIIERLQEEEDESAYLQTCRW